MPNVAPTGAMVGVIVLMDGPEARTGMLVPKKINKEMAKAEMVDAERRIDSPLTEDSYFDSARVELPVPALCYSFSGTKAIVRICCLWSPADILWKLTACTLLHEL